MKKGASNIILALSIILVLLLCVWFFAYLPKFGSVVSGNSIDWSGFGDFFWGLGTMLFTALSVWALYRVNESLNDFNENLQQKKIGFEKWLEESRQKFQIELENKRREIQKEKIRQKRFENWLEKYYVLVLKLTSSKLSSDVEWLDVLRELTVIYRAIGADNLIETTEETKPLLEKMQKVSTNIRNTVIHAVITPKSKEQLLLFYQNLGLGTDIIQLYFEMISFKKDLPEIKVEDFLTMEKSTPKDKQKK